MPELDGKATHEDFITPFDAHDKVVRDSGDYEHQEYPKAVDHVQKPGAPEGHFEPILQNEPAEEEEEEE